MAASELKILAIDDNRDNLTALRAVILDRLPGARVLTARDGRAGLELASAEDPDVILLDIVMPDLDGYEVCRALKADDRLRGIPVLFLTALRTDLASRVAAVDAGAEGFLCKPFDEIELVAQIRAMAKIKAASRQRRMERDELEALVARRTGQLVQELAERKKLEMERQKFFLLVESSSEFIGMCDLDLQPNYVNPAGIRMVGLPDLAAACRVKVQDYFFPEDQRFIAEEFFPRVMRDGHGDVEIRLRHFQTGQSILVLYSLFSVRDASGGHVGWATVSRDITESNRLAEERAQLENQLRQAQKVEAIGRLAGGVAHDFNNITAIILGYGEILLSRLGPEDRLRKYVEQIVEAGRRSAGLTRQLLAFSRKQTLQPEALDLNVLLRNFEKMLGRLIGEDVELEFRLAADLHRVTADPGQIEQVVTNLAINARDAMPRGGRLTIETADVELDEMYAAGHLGVVPGRYVMLALTDTGCGMDKATMSRLFEPFFTTKEKGKGTGLGLATVYGIVKQSGGNIWAYSEPGQGTCFKIHLPQTDKPAEARLEAKAGAPVPRGGGERILVVEDEAALRELCETVLSRLGYRVSTAENGSAALRLVREQGLDFDLVLTDVIMPVMGGAELVERLRSDRPGLTALYMSGYPDDALAPHGVLEPGIPFIQKPFSERVLAVKIREVLGQTAAAAPQGASVLMIDDDEQYRELVRHFCTKRGHACTGVDSAAAALASLAAQSFDVLLVDLNIPGTSGEAVLREIRAAGCTAPAVVLTGDVASADMDVLRPLGAALALEKSSDGGPLLQAIAAAGPAGSPAPSPASGRGTA